MSNVSVSASEMDLGAKEKRRVALSSVSAAVFLTSMKIVVGILTGSLGILAEAAHSGLDLVAAAMTYFAVNLSSRPADSKHSYGHGKIENLSALFETLLLLLTCAWIIYEAINRLFFKEVAVEATVWSFLVMGVSIIIDYSRSRLLYRTARKYESQALEADALHFSTDIWSSSVVIGGLVLVLISEQLNLPWLIKGDAVAAMVVAGIVIYVSYQLGRKAIGDLIDEVPATLYNQLTEAVKVDGVIEARQVRARRSGPDYFVDVTVAVNRDTSSGQAHAIAERVEEGVNGILPKAHVLVHVDPVQKEDEDLTESVRVLAAQYGLGVHNIRLRQVGPRKVLMVHLDVKDELAVNQAHTLASAFEEAIKKAHPWLSEVNTHLEPTYREANSNRPLTQSHDRQVESIVNQLPQQTQIPCNIKHVNIFHQADQIDISFDCVFDGDMPHADAHEYTEEMENALREQIPNLGQVFIHVEPKNEAQ